MKRASFACLAASLTMSLLACSGTNAAVVGTTSTDSGSAAATGSGDDDSGVVLPQEPISNGKSDTPVEDAAAAPGTLDGGTIVDGSTTLEASTNDASTAVNGCSDADFAKNDQSGAAGTRTVDVGGGNGNGGGHGGGGGGGNGNRPRCMRIKITETVTFQGQFGNAPLEPSGGTTPSPILETKTGQSVSFVFPAVGTFGFKTISGNSVEGAINVTP